MSRPLASNYSTWRKSLLKDYVERYNVSLPDLATSRIHQREKKKTIVSLETYPVQITHFSKTTQNNNLNIVGTGKKGGLLKRN